MPELTEQEKLERRRQKRQQRILASAENRLSRITGTAFAHRASPTPSPSTSTSSLVRPEKSQSDRPRSRSPSPAVFRSNSTSARSRRPLPTDDPSEELGAPPPLQHPMFDFLATPSPAGTPEPTPDLQQLLSASPFPINPALLSAFAPSTAPVQKTRSDRYWKLLHFVSMVWLGIYAVYYEWAVVGVDRFSALLAHPDKHTVNLFPLFWYFTTLELIMQTARMMYQREPVSQPVWAGLIQQLPPPLANAITVLLRYRLIWSCLVQDSCVLVFVIGVAQVISAIIV